jgi:ferredoxin-NADP reductase
VKQKVGASRVIYDMRVGDEIELLDICGRGFHLDEMTGRDLVFVAMGTGGSAVAVGVAACVETQK